MRKRGFLHFLCFGLLALLLSGCGNDDRDGVGKEKVEVKAALVHDAYIWQRVWTPALADAVHTATPVVRQWRVLAAQASGNKQLKRFEPNWGALASSGRPVVMVVRIDGQLQNFDQEEMLAQIGALYKTWLQKGAEHGVSISGVEMDYDCGTQRLAAYAQFLGRLRQLLHALDESNSKQVQLSITALPDWLNAQELDAVLAVVDQSVLQVHSVIDPKVGGLFNAQAARRWVDAYARRMSSSGSGHNKSFLIALPNYGSRVSWDREGRIAAVTSEAPVNAGLLGIGEDAQGQSQELSANPQEIAAFLRDMEASASKGDFSNLMGIAWFRLPTAQDQRAWAMPTWLAVIKGEPLVAKVEAFLAPSPEDGAFYRIMLNNSGDADTVLPEQVHLPKTCRHADAVRVNGYTLKNEGDMIYLRRQDESLLRAGQSREIGWARCGLGVDIILQVR